jgi:hypothetical protein
MEPTKEEQEEAMMEKQIDDYHDSMEELAYHRWFAKNQDLLVTEFIKVAQADFDQYCRQFWKYAPKEE